MNEQSRPVVTLRVRARGDAYGVLDGSTFALVRQDSESTWKFADREGQTNVVVREGSNSSVTVNGQEQAEDVVPHPWGLLMGLHDVAPHVFDAVPQSVTQTDRGEAGRQVTFLTTGGLRVILDVAREGFIVRKQVIRGDELLDEVVLEGPELPGPA